MGRVVPFKLKNRFKNDFKSILSWVLQVGCFQSVRIEKCGKERQVGKEKNEGEGKRRG